MLFVFPTSCSNETLQIIYVFPEKEYLFALKLLPDHLISYC